MSEPEDTDSTTDTAINATCAALEAFKSQLHALDEQERIIDGLNGYGKVEFAARMTNLFIYYRFPREPSWNSLAKQARRLYKTFNCKSQIQATLRDPASPWSESVNALSTRMDEYLTVPDNEARNAAIRSLGKLREYGEAVERDLEQEAQHELIRRAVHDAFFSGHGGSTAGSAPL